MLSIAAIIERELTNWGAISRKAAILPMTDEERQRAMDFIVAQEARDAADIEKLDESLIGSSMP